MLGYPPMPPESRIPNMQLLFTLLIGLSAFGASPEAQIKIAKTDHALTVQVIPPGGTHLNFDGPWKLEITGAIPLSNMKGVFGIADFDKATGSFTLPLARQPKADDQGEYSLVYFFCAADNSWCKRAQAKGVL